MFATDLLSQNNQSFLYNGYAYQFGKLLGQGAFGSVYAVLGNPQFVIKVIHIKSEKHEAIISREIEFTQVVLNHPFIIRSFSHTCKDNTYHILYERILGRSLHDLTAKPLALALKCHIATQLFCALDYLHKQSVLHRDIKPHNIMIQTKPFHVKLIDFGLSRYVSDHQGISGTKVYNAPELYLPTVTQTTAIDRWSAGCCLFTLLFNHNIFVASQTKPFAKNNTAIIQQIHSRLHAFLDNHEAHQDPELAPMLRLITALLAFEPDRRPTAIEAIQTIQTVYNQIGRPDNSQALWEATVSDQPDATYIGLDTQFGGYSQA